MRKVATKNDPITAAIPDDTVDQVSFGKAPHSSFAFEKHFIQRLSSNELPCTFAMGLYQIFADISGKISFEIHERSI